MKTLKKESDDILARASPRERGAGRLLPRRRRGAARSPALRSRRKVPATLRDRGGDRQGGRDSQPPLPGSRLTRPNSPTISTSIRDMRRLLLQGKGDHRRRPADPQGATGMPSRTSRVVSRLWWRNLEAPSSRWGKKHQAGYSWIRVRISIPAETLDGRITNHHRKEKSGKSHLAKILLRGLLENGAYAVVLTSTTNTAPVVQRRDGTETAARRKAEGPPPGAGPEVSAGVGGAEGR